MWKSVKMLPILLYICIGLCLSRGNAHWNPFNSVTRLMEKEAAKARNSVISETDKVANYIDEQLKQTEFTLKRAREEAIRAKDVMSDHFADTMKRIEDQLNGYVEQFKETGRTIDDRVSLHRPSEENEGDRIDNPDAVLSVPSMVLRHGYPCETHGVISQGYVLNLHRIPRSKTGRTASSKTVLLQHGVAASSADWVLGGPGRGLAYVLADAGYDVWMANARGNRYSREHIEYGKDTKSYWDFSWHEIAFHDQPAVIDYITNVTDSKGKIAYIGHSMGTTILFAMLSLRPEYNDILGAGIALAPVVFVSNIRSPLKTLAPMAGAVAYADALLGNYEFVPKDSSLGRLSRSCNIEHLDSLVCKNVIFHLCGYDEAQFDATLLPSVLAHLGAGTSWKTILHFSQEVVAKKFQQYDYGYSQNMRAYGSPQPPEYDLSLVTLPVILFWAENDPLSTESDVMELRGRLPRAVRAYLVPLPEFNHLDYLYAVDAPTLINSKVLEFLSDTYKDKETVSFNFAFG